MARHCIHKQDHGLQEALDLRLIELAKPALESGIQVEATLPIRNVHRTAGAMLGGEIARRYGSAGLPEDTIRFHFHGSAGQSFGAFLPNGVTLTLEGEANDYVGKGLSGGRIIVHPPKNSGFVPEESILVGNVVLYGATSGDVFLNGIAGERFAVRNSGATAVVEGVGDHGCEYMTNGLVIVLGACGRNFAAGMSGGIAYVFDEHGDFASERCNRASVDLEVLDQNDVATLRKLIERHRDLTESPLAGRILERWSRLLPRFVKVFPQEFRRAMAAEHAKGASGCKLDAAGGDSPTSSDRAGAACLSRMDLWNSARELPERRPVAERINDWFEIYRDLPDEKLQQQGARCMDCGVPFCHTGCPVNNIIPDWNELVYENRWEDAVRRLHATNNFPEFTGRICPAPCEAACVLGINQPAVTIKQIEKSIVDRGFLEGWIRPEPPARHSGKRVAVVGSGPAGLAAAQQLCRAGHGVTVYEKADRIGGLLIYGIPNFKLEKHVVQRRIEQLAAEGVKFVMGANVGVDIPIDQLRREFDAVLLATGAEQHRELKVPGRELNGIHLAMDYLVQANRRCLGDTLDPSLDILATGKNVIIIGGGDTGADCLGTTHRQKAKSVRQFQIHPMPPEMRSEKTPWPMWPLMLRSEGAHEEGGIRTWNVLTLGFSGDEHGNVRQLHGVEVGPAPRFERVPGIGIYARCRARPGRNWVFGPGAGGHDRAARRSARPAWQRGDRREIYDLGR